MMCMEIQWCPEQSFLLLSLSLSLWMDQIISETCPGHSSFAVCRCGILGWKNQINLKVTVVIKTEKLCAKRNTSINSVLLLLLLYSPIFAHDIPGRVCVCVCVCVFVCVMYLLRYQCSRLSKSRSRPRPHPFQTRQSFTHGQ